jgi:N-acetylglucosaminyl-diphospho-decaprenol L-rhamnosyltransferase
VSEGTVVTAVIVTYNSVALIDDCLSALTGDPRVEVVVVDSGSSDGSADQAGLHDGVTVIRKLENLGWSACSNAGAAAANSPALAFVNPDTRASAHDLVTLASHLDGNTAMAAPRFANENGTEQYFYFRFPTPITGPFLYLNSGQRLDAKLGRRVIKWHVYGEKLPIRERIDHAGAACLLVDAVEFRHVGGFDESMWLFFSDVDLSRRLALSGRNLVVDWDTSVTHIGGGSVNELGLDRLQLMVQADYVAYTRVAFGPAGQFFTRAAVWVFSGVIPALFALSRIDPTGARDCLRRARTVLKK